jgi:zinc protease
MVCALLVWTPCRGAGAPASLVPTRTVLKNGLTVLVAEQHGLPLVAVRLVVRTGAAADPPGKEGLAALTALLLTKGAGSRSAAEIAETVDFHGGTLEMDHTHDATYLSGSMLSRDRDILMDLIADAAMHPGFPEEEIVRERERMMASIAQTRENAGYLADTFFNRFLYGPHPYSRPELGTVESIAGLTRHDVVMFHRTYYAPNNAFLVIVGDIREEEAMKKVQQAFQAWPKRSLPGMAHPPAPEVRPSTVRVIDKPDISQAHVRIGTLGIPRNHPDYIPLLVANTILGGGGFTSRLVDRIRVDRGLTYGIDSQFTPHRERGAFVVSSFTKTETAGALVGAILNELRLFREQGVSASEVQAARHYLLGVFPLSLEGPRALANQLVGMELFGLPMDDIQTYEARIRAVTPDDVMRVIRRYMPDEAWLCVLLGNADRVIPQVERFGPVERHPFK